MNRKALQHELYGPIKLTVETAANQAVVLYNPSQSADNAERFGRIQTALGGFMDAFERVGGNSIPLDRALSELSLRTPALKAIAAEFDPESNQPLIDALGEAKHSLDSALNAHRQR